MPRELTRLAGRCVVRYSNSGKLAQGGYKNFLRMKVTGDEVTVFPVGIDTVCRHWTFDADNPVGEASHLRPATGAIATRLINTPLTVR